MNMLATIPPVTTAAPMADATPIDADSSITAWEVRQRLLAASARVGVGHFSMTFNVGDDNATYVTHWYKPDPHAFQDCRSVACGSLLHCLDAVDAYAAQWAREHAPVPAIAAE